MRTTRKSYYKNPGVSNTNCKKRSNKKGIKWLAYNNWIKSTLTWRTISVCSRTKSTWRRSHARTLKVLIIFYSLITRDSLRIKSSFMLRRHRTLGIKAAVNICRLRRRWWPRLRIVSMHRGRCNNNNKAMCLCVRRQRAVIEKQARCQYHIMCMKTTMRVQI